MDGVWGWGGQQILLITQGEYFIQDRHPSIPFFVNRPIPAVTRLRVHLKFVAAHTWQSRDPEEHVHST